MAVVMVVAAIFEEGILVFRIYPIRSVLDFVIRVGVNNTETGLSTQRLFQNAKMAEKPRQSVYHFGVLKQSLPTRSIDSLQWVLVLIL